SPPRSSALHFFPTRRSSDLRSSRRNRVWFVVFSVISHKIVFFPTGTAFPDSHFCIVGLRLTNGNEHSCSESRHPDDFLSDSYSTKPSKKQVAQLSMGDDDRPGYPTQIPVFGEFPVVF